MSGRILEKAFNALIASAHSLKTGIMDDFKEEMISELRNELAEISNFKHSDSPAILKEEKQIKEYIKTIAKLKKNIERHNKELLKINENHAKHAAKFTEECTKDSDSSKISADMRGIISRHITEISRLSSELGQLLNAKTEILESLDEKIHALADSYGSIFIKTDMDQLNKGFENLDLVSRLASLERSYDAVDSPDTLRQIQTQAAPLVIAFRQCILSAEHLAGLAAKQEAAASAACSASAAASSSSHTVAAAASPSSS